MVGFINRNHDIKVTDGVLASASAACKGGAVHSVERGDFALKRLSVTQADVQPSASAESGQQFNAVKHALL